MVTLDLARPRVCLIPESVSSRGQEAVECAASAGLHLDAAQQFVLDGALGVRDDGKWSAFEVGVNQPRQNGKDGILEALELTALFEWGERLVIHSAHLFATSKEHFVRLVNLIDGSDELRRRIKKPKHSHGEEGIELLTGERIRFFTRMKGSARGFSCDRLLYNEAMILPEASHGAMLPTLSARPNPQVWYTGSAVDQLIHEHGVVFARIRERGLTGYDASLAYFEWSAAREDFAGPEDVPEEVAADEAVWAEANPALGIRITAEHIANERRSMDPRTFAVERLGVGDWPRTDGAVTSLIGREQWSALLYDKSTLIDPVCIAYDIAPDRSTAAIAAAGRNQDGHWHVEIIDHQRGTAWLAERWARLIEKHEPVRKVCDKYSKLPDIDEAESVNVEDHGLACGRFVDLVHEGTLRHLGSAELATAVLGAQTRPLGDAAWAWSRRNSNVDITPLVAASLAVSAAVSCWDDGSDPVIY